MRIVLFKIDTKHFRIVVPALTERNPFPDNPYVEVESLDARRRPQWRTAKSFGNDQMIRLLAMALYSQDRAEPGLGEYHGDTLIDLGTLRDLVGHRE